jgi:hypothetical protein
VGLNISDENLQALEDAPEDARRKFFEGLSQEERDTLYTAASDWKQRKSQPAKESSVSAPRALYEGFRQGFTKNWLDEMAGAADALTGNEGVSYQKMPDGQVKEIQPGQPTRDFVRAQGDKAYAERPGWTLAGNVAGELATDAALAYVSGGKLSPTNPVVGTALGALSGAGAADENTPGGKIGGGLFGGGVALAGHGVGKYAVAPAMRAAGRYGGKVVDALDPGVREFVEKRLGAARQKAQGMATDAVNEEVDSLGGRARAEVQKASRLTENVRRIPGKEVPASSQQLAEMAAAAAQKAREKARQLRAAADAVGADGSEQVSGEFAAKGALARGNKAHEQAQILEQAAFRLEQQAAEAAQGSVSGVESGLEAARKAALESPEFAAVENFVLKNNLDDIPEAVPRAAAAKEAWKVARENAPGAIAQKTEDILSPREALEQVKVRAQRYVPPVLGDLVGRGSLGGAAVGAAAGGLLGGDWKDAGLGALAGAGLRPGIHSLRRGWQHPATQTAVFGSMKKLLAVPEKLGAYGPRLLEAAQQGGNKLAVMHYVLISRDPTYRALVQRLMAEAPSSDAEPQATP